jgi:carbamoyl-phosphate synthase small subunit
VPYAVENAKAILGQKPVFGICMGHQVLGQAFGAKTFKLKFGHHGGNHPLRYTPTGEPPPPPAACSAACSLHLEAAAPTQSWASATTAAALSGEVPACPPPPPPCLPPGRIEISAQNHNFAVDTATLPPEVEVSLINLNDGTCAGMVHPGLRAMTVQSHPEASPGPHDSDVAFEQVRGWQSAVLWCCPDGRLAVRVAHHSRAGQGSTTLSFLAQR